MTSTATNDYPTKGTPYVSNPLAVALERYEHTGGGYIRRSGGRAKGEVAADLEYELRELLAECEYHAMAYGSDPKEELPKVRRVLCYAVTGSNEGHYVHVDLETTEQGREPPKRIPFYLVKTFMGWDHAWAIAKRAAELLEA